MQARLTVLTAALCGGWAASSAPAAGTAASWLPGTLLAGFIPAEVWRNSGQVKLYLGGNGDEGGVAGSDRHTTFGSGPTPSEAIKAADCSHCTEVSSEMLSFES